MLWRCISVEKILCSPLTNQLGILGVIISHGVTRLLQFTNLPGNLSGDLTLYFIVIYLKKSKKHQIINYLGTLVVKEEKHSR